MLEESPSAKAKERRPCPGCGSLTRHIYVNIKDTLVVSDDLAIKAKRVGQRKPFLEQKIGSDLHHATGTRRHRVMVVDRDRDRYKKVVTDRSRARNSIARKSPCPSTETGGARRRKTGAERTGLITAARGGGPR